jgi:hypothetical protein
MKLYRLLYHEEFKIYRVAECGTRVDGNMLLGDFTPVINGCFKELSNIVVRESFTSSSLYLILSQPIL